MTNPDDIAVAILTAIRSALDTLAPESRIQIRTTQINFLTEATKNFQIVRDQLQIVAHRTNNQDDWRLFRISRNTARQSVRSVKKSYSGDPNKVWEAARKLAGETLSGPPTKLSIDGRVETSPRNISEELNSNFIEKIEKIRQGFGDGIDDPMENYN